jgi:succinate-semialdehyde dehydrogenase/glutarate-semialdehyde dehydrogenase
MVISSADSIASINPATKEKLGEVPLMHAGQVEEAVAGAWRAFDIWQMTNFAERSKMVMSFHKVLEKHADEVAALITAEVGKPVVEAYMSELTGPLDTCVYLTENIETLLKEQTLNFANPLLSSKQSSIVFDPLGVIGIISPWNYPFSIPVMNMLAALMTGNTVVLKPSEKSPLIGLKIGELFEKAGFPRGVVTVITGDRRTGEALTKCKLSRIIFTGSVAGGASVMAQAAPNIVPVSMELGGKDPAIVLPDAPIDWTAKGLVWGAFTNAGQACASIERVYIIKGKNTDKLIERIVYHTSQLRLGQPTNPDTEIGPVVDEQQLLKIVDQVEKAKAEGAKILCGGNRRDDLGGYFFEPTVMTDVNHKMDIMTVETFGPVMPIMIVNSEDEAVMLANDSEYGLAASVWSPNLRRCEAIARDLNTGTVLMNDCLFSHASPQVPWGGTKKSGIGRSHGQFGLLDLVNIKHICTDSAGGGNRVWWYPYGQTRVKVAQGGIKLLHGSNILTKFKGMIEFVGNLFKNPRAGG